MQVRVRMRVRVGVRVVLRRYASHLEPHLKSRAISKSYPHKRYYILVPWDPWPAPAARPPRTGPRGRGGAGRGGLLAVRLAVPGVQAGAECPVAPVSRVPVGIVEPSRPLPGRGRSGAAADPPGLPNYKRLTKRKEFPLGYFSHIELAQKVNNGNGRIT